MKKGPVRDSKLKIFLLSRLGRESWRFEIKVRVGKIVCETSGGGGDERIRTGGGAIDLKIESLVGDKVGKCGGECQRGEMNGRGG